jgi:hypothetical protein
MVYSQNEIMLFNIAFYVVMNYDYLQAIKSVNIPIRI